MATLKERIDAAKKIRITTTVPKEQLPAWVARLDITHEYPVRATKELTR